MSKETITLLVNGAIALAVVVFIGLERIPLETGALVVVALATPSALPLIADKFRRGPPPSGVLLLLAATAHLATFVACREADTPRQTLPSYCYDETKLTAELAKCPATKATKAESRACRAEINASCGFVETVADGGAR